jgi:hypothetical protein
MAEETKDPEVFLTQVNDAIEDLSGAIGDFLEKMASFVNDHLTEAGVLGGAAAGSIFGPLGTIAGGLIGGRRATSSRRSSRLRARRSARSGTALSAASARRSAA